MQYMVKAIVRQWHCNLFTKIASIYYLCGYNSISGKCIGKIREIVMELISPLYNHHPIGREKKEINSRAFHDFRSQANSLMHYQSMPIELCAEIPFRNAIWAILVPLLYQIYPHTMCRASHLRAQKDDGCARHFVCQWGARASLNAVVVFTIKQYCVLLGFSVLVVGHFPNTPYAKGRTISIAISPAQRNI